MARILDENSFKMESCWYRNRNKIPVDFLINFICFLEEKWRPGEPGKALERKPKSKEKGRPLPGASEAPKWSQNDTKMNSKLIQNGSNMNAKWNQNGDSCNHHSTMSFLKWNYKNGCVHRFFDYYVNITT